MKPGLGTLALAVLIMIGFAVPLLDRLWQPEPGILQAWRQQDEPIAPVERRVPEMPAVTREAPIEPAPIQAIETPVPEPTEPDPAVEAEPPIEAASAEPAPELEERIVVEPEPDQAAVAPELVPPPPLPTPSDAEAQAEPSEPSPEPEAPIEPAVVPPPEPVVEESPAEPAPPSEPTAAAAVDEEPEAEAEALPPSQEVVRRTQADLARLGYRPGPADGLMGRRTREAIEAYQRENDLAVDGRPSEALLDDMAEKVAALPVPVPTPAAPSAPLSAAAAADGGQIYLIQDRLAKLGFSQIRRNGQLDARTVAAIRAYQRASGLRQDGRPSEALLDHLERRLLRPGLGGRS